MTDWSLQEQAESFATELTLLLQRTLPKAPAAVAKVTGNRVLVQPSGPVRLFVGGHPLAELDVSLRCQLDSRGTWLAIEDSNYGLRAIADRAPVLRFHYVREKQRPPAAHLHVHAHRGALSHLLSQSGHAEPHDISALHIPLGGSRFRPCLEDVVQFLIEECGFDRLDSWREAVKEGRADWRKKQLRAVIRDCQGEAAETLRDLGYTVSPPDGGPPEASEKALHAW